jgi:hypothetical protein
MCIFSLVLLENNSNSNSNSKDNNIDLTSESKYYIGLINDINKNDINKNDINKNDINKNDINKNDINKNDINKEVKEKELENIIRWFIVYNKCNEFLNQCDVLINN